METKMYVITHKMVNIPQISSYTSLFVGAANHETDGNFDEKDNTGSNISQKNSSYCELTGLYWIWKNSNADYVGISHYRRFFSNNAVLGAQKYYINKKDIEEVLTKKRIILPKPRCYEKTTLLAINYAPNRTDVKEMFRAVETCSPDYTKDFIWYFNQNKSYLRWLLWWSYR